MSLSGLGRRLLQIVVVHLALFLLCKINNGYCFLKNIQVFPWAQKGLCVGSGRWESFKPWKSDLAFFWCKCSNNKMKTSVLL